MAEYLASQIAAGKLKYYDVVQKFPQYKDGIDTKLKEDGVYNKINKESDAKI